MILHEILNDYIGHEFHIDKELNLKLQMDCNTDSLLLSYMSLIDSWDAREYFNDTTESSEFLSSGIFTEKEEKEIQKIEEEVLLESVLMQYEDVNAQKRTRNRYPNNKSFWETQWGELITNENTYNPLSREGKTFRRRFRLPFPLFKYLVQICKEENVFESIYTSKILPIEAKVLGCLRILGRDACADDITEDTGNIIGESTMHYVFKKFINGMTTKIYPRFMKLPTGEYLKEVLDVYAAVGLPGCVGSMDCTHIKWAQCPKKNFSCTW